MQFSKVAKCLDKVINIGSVALYHCNNSRQEVPHTRQLYMYKGSGKMLPQRFKGQK